MLGQEEALKRTETRRPLFTRRGFRDSGEAILVYTHGIICQVPLQ